MNRTIVKAVVAVSLMSIAASVFGSEKMEDSRTGSSAVRRTTGGSLSVKSAEAYPLNLDVQGETTTSQLHFRPSYDELFTADHASVRFARKDENGWQNRSVYSGAAPVLSMQEGTVANQLLILDTTALQVVDFSAEEARVLGTFPIDNRALRSGGHLVERFADNVYLIDASLPGFRVVSIEDPSVMRELTSFATSEVPVEITLRTSHVYLRLNGEVAIVSVGDFIMPKPSERTRLRGSAGIRSIGFDGEGSLFLGDGASLQVVDADPESTTFLQVQSTLQMPASIERVVVQQGRAFVLDPTGALEIVAVPQRRVPEHQVPEQ